jgi:hypothetical protein
MELETQQEPKAFTMLVCWHCYYLPPALAIAKRASETSLRERERERERLDLEHLTIPTVHTV